ncbi:phage tail protein [Alteromonas sp. C1M14]|uniref:phage tail protein n=1 Tax=Alteromonas sp. C1M14 TaxID=2841567 RepID=UPI001C095791|nr:phage tail protein [Alteromonas sp. C1M14]MBU2979000.1 phage tail protein [Alteromonas sp. C1M14]
MPPVIIGVAVAFAATAVVTVGYAIAIGVAVAIAADAMMPDVSAGLGGVDTTNQTLRTETNSSQIMIVGEAVTSGPITKYEKRTFNEKEYHLFCTPLAAHPCESVELYQLDGAARGSLTGNGYRILVELGDQTTANATLLSEMTTVDNTFVGFGITYAYHKYEINTELFPNGVQDVKFLVKGISVYDPRKDSTVGGAGTHRADDETTWEWSDNAALINIHWKRFGGDYEIPVEMFDMQNLAYEANLCDELVTFLDKDGTSYTEKRWTCNGVIDLNKGQRLVEEELLKSCGGRWVEAGGIFYLLTAAYRGPATVTLTDDDLIDGYDIDRTPYTELEDRCNAVSATFVDPKSYYQSTTCTEIESTYYQTVRDKRYLMHSRELGYTNSDTMCQRLNRIYMEQLSTGDTLKVVVGWKGLKCAPGTVVNVNFEDARIIGKEYEVMDYDFDDSNMEWTLVLKETGPSIFDDSIIPSEKDLLPNSTIDNTVITPPSAVNYTPTPNDGYRQGYLSWNHDAPLSLRRYVVLITRLPDDGWSKVFYPVDPTVDINTLDVGTYRAAVSAQNRFEKTSVAAVHDFTVGATSTPDSATATISVLPGRVIIHGPTLPNNTATYEWRYYFADEFDDAFKAGKNDTITVTDTPQDGTLYVWYRLIDKNQPDSTWQEIVVPNLIGIEVPPIDPEEVANLMLPGLPASVIDTINNVTSDISLWSTQSGELGDDYSVLLYNVTEAVSASHANRLDIIAVKEQVGDSSVNAQVVDYFNAQIGYEDEFGNWVDGPLAQRLVETSVDTLDGDSMSVYAYLQALETASGGLEGQFRLVIDSAGRWTGIFGTDDGVTSDVTIATENLHITHSDGREAMRLNTSTNELEFFGSGVFSGTLTSAKSITIGDSFMKVEDPDGFGPDDVWYWYGPRIVDGNGDPNYAALSKSNAYEWKDTQANGGIAGSFLEGQLLRQKYATSTTTSVTAAGHVSNGKPVTINCQIVFRIQYSTPNQLDGEPTELQYWIKRDSTVIKSGTLPCNRTEIDPGGEPGVNWITKDHCAFSPAFVDTSNLATTYDYTLEVYDWSPAGTTSYALEIMTNENLIG